MNYNVAVNLIHRNLASESGTNTTANNIASGAAVLQENDTEFTRRRPGTNDRAPAAS